MNLMKKPLIVALLTVVLTGPAFAHKLTLSSELLRVLQGGAGKYALPAPGSGLVKRIPGMYLPRGLTEQQLQDKIRFLTSSAQIPTTKEGRLTVVQNPELLRRLEQELGKPLFEGRPLSEIKTRTLITNYLNRFAKAREEGT